MCGHFFSVNWFSLTVQGTRTIKWYSKMWRCRREGFAKWNSIAHFEVPWIQNETLKQGCAWLGSIGPLFICISLVLMWCDHIFCQASRPSEVCLFKSLGPRERGCKWFQMPGCFSHQLWCIRFLLRLSSISSPCYCTSINQYTLQAHRGTCGKNTMPCSHTYLNIQGLCVADDWATHHSLANPWQWKKWLLFGNT